ncbi:hypothetical protein [Halosegnis sp.]|uniref:hypothetical protein n=1 Tax=Halosegnis sp. TaxID=2864959 RepID=UPI0035D4270F
MSTDATADETENSSESVADRDFQRMLETAGLAVAALFALVAAVGFYTSTRRVIDIWVAREFQPVFAAGFNLAVLLAMLAIVAVLLRRVD